MYEKPSEPEAVPGREASRAGGLLAAFSIALLGLAGGAGVGALFLGPAVAPMLVPTLGAASSDGGGGERWGSHEEPAPSLFTVEHLLVNPANSEGSRFLLVSVALELRDAGLVTSVGAREAELRDALIRCLGSKTVDELADMGQRDALSEEILAALAQVVGPGVIDKIFLPQYVIR